MQSVQKKKVLSLEWKSEGATDDESGESMEEVPLKGLGESGLQWWVKSAFIKIYQINELGLSQIWHHKYWHHYYHYHH